MMSQTVQEILEQIQKLPDEDRLALEEQLAQWEETKSTLGEKDQSRYPLRGSVIRYERPTEPAAEDKWEASR